MATEIPVILTEFGILEPLVDYLLEKSNARSFSWMQKVVQSVGLFLDYMSSNHNCFDDPKDMFAAFLQRLYTGTIGEDGNDPSGLYWLPKSSRVVGQLISQISQFSDWMAARLGTTPLNPWRQATRHEEMLNWAAFHQKHSRAFLGHTWDIAMASETAKQARNVLLKRNPTVDRDRVKCFPDSCFLDLIFKGFVVPGKRHSSRLEEQLNLRDILITLLQNCGGVRMSESFHLYIHDVVPDPHDPEMAMVRIFHPSEGLAPDDWRDVKGNPKKGIRKAYLREKYGIRPRTDYFQTDAMHAGWKGGALDSKAYFMHIYWFPSWAGKLFKKFWDLYMVQRALIRADHPFAFVSSSGAPYSLDAYVEAHDRAVLRIGLKSAKMNGTTPHGHRHAYGQRLADAKIDPIILKKALHHKSLESQLAYTEPRFEKVTKELEIATAAMDEGREMPPPNFLQYGFEDIDPIGLFSGPYPKFTRR